MAELCVRSPVFWVAVWATKKQVLQKVRTLQMLQSVQKLKGCKCWLISSTEGQKSPLQINESTSFVFTTWNWEKHCCKIKKLFLLTCVFKLIKKLSCNKFAFPKKRFYNQWCEENSSSSDSLIPLLYQKGYFYWSYVVPLALSQKIKLKNLCLALSKQTRHYLYG